MGGCACAKGFIGQGAVPRHPTTLRPLGNRTGVSRELIRKGHVRRVRSATTATAVVAPPPPPAMTTPALSRQTLRLRALAAAPR
jgi:hypothetical protein